MQPISTTLAKGKSHTVIDCWIWKGTSRTYSPASLFCKSRKLRTKEERRLFFKVTELGGNSGFPPACWPRQILNGIPWDITTTCMTHLRRQTVNEAGLESQASSLLVHLSSETSWEAPSLQAAQIRMNFLWHAGSSDISRTSRCSL